MASSIAVRRLTGGSSGLLNRLSAARPVNAISFAPAATRKYGANAQMRRRDDDEEENDFELEHRRGVNGRAVGGRREFPGFFSDVFDPFMSTRSVSQLMNMVDQLMDTPLATLSRAAAPVGRRGWDLKEDESSLHLSMDMPGLGKEDVKVIVEENTLIIKGEGEKETEQAKRYSTRIDLTSKLYKVDGIKAEMKNGVLKVMIPKVKEDERKDVFQVNVE
ncbi:Small heat shock protein, chloroplastic-like protein [Drosera capensis]